MIDRKRRVKRLFLKINFQSESWFYFFSAFAFGMFRCKHQCINTLGNQLVSVHTNQLKLIVHDGKNIKTTLSFREGNGRSTRIWLDMILKQNVKMCVDWSKINKQEYLNAMTHSVVDSAPIKKLLFAALTDKIDDSETFMKGIDYSYYYEQED